VSAIIFDCDGVLADTERYGHLPAFNQTFAEVGVPLQWSEEEYGHKLGKREYKKNIKKNKLSNKVYKIKQFKLNTHKITV
jgi:beta-phosphoglucomutase-like phosphatase (HAD superfamily)